ncbi:DUF2071 domain-containing protein [Chryseolinea sp. H1M3-3]|uniref:YqjF family protein n=1 Tax=Chryseolinea sp. H1M3-3 TaxID=3034144 RepID=UPI0023EB8C0C|nr:DUF2071 domain-containing protein [Chryseolinea sp. H1M3-3]
MVTNTHKPLRKNVQRKSADVSGYTNDQPKMIAIDDILGDTKHRPFDYPKNDWKYYQEWNNALFFHWKVAYDTLRKLVPQKLNLDTYEGVTYVSLVAFTMQKIRPRNLQPIKFISDFDEINIRTYIDNDNRKGVYFLNIEAGKHLSTLIAKTLSGLPYEKSNIQRTSENYKSTNIQKSFNLDTEFEVKKRPTEKSTLDNWLTERYCLYFERAKTIYRYDIHHKEWEIKHVDIKRLNVNYKIGDLDFINKPDLIHYSDGVKVLAWQRARV